MSKSVESYCNSRNQVEMSTYSSSNSKTFTGAVYLRNASTSYGLHFNKIKVFNNLNLTVEKGTVYALLSASGCGKTTILNCILGFQKLDSGHIWVLGGTPGTKSSAVPGKRVGYMPQETALYQHFTIRETLTYYGWIAGMTKEEINQRIEFLTNLLLLPITGQFITDLSGGQQRRVSFAAALIHSPELLLLDEPTVGLDSTVRDMVWNHLSQLAHKFGTTVIITTHYIEEAKKANCVALMRNHSILVEEPPLELIERFEAGSLEEVFFKLSVKQNLVEEKNEIDESKCVVFKTLAEIPPAEGNSGQHCNWLYFDKNHIKVLIWRNLLWMMRNFSYTVVILFLLPIISLSLMLVGIGKNPSNLSIAIVNYETNNSNCDATLSCNSSQLSCAYVKYLQESGLNLVNYNSEDTAISSVISAENYASVVIPFNYTKALKSRFDRPISVTPWNIKSSEIVVSRDIFNKPIANFIKAIFYESFQLFIEDYAETCGNDRKALKFPMAFQKPIYGDYKIEFTDYILPGFILGLIFLLMLTNTTVSMLVERRENGVIRGLALNLTIKELLLSHIMVDCVFVLIQTIIIISLVFGGFSMTIKGSFLLVACIIYLTGCCGMYCGFLLSAFCKTDTEAGIIATGAFMTILILGGIIWPLEAMHHLLRPLVKFIPLTNAVISFRNIVQKGWHLNHVSVYKGFVTINMWSALFVIGALCLLKFKRRANI